MPLTRLSLVPREMQMGATVTPLMVGSKPLPRQLAGFHGTGVEYHGTTEATKPALGRGFPPRALVSKKARRLSSSRRSRENWLCRKGLAP